MVDQAQALREQIRSRHQKRPTASTRLITVTSGKGGVGKSNFTINFALALQSMNYRTLIFDADIGFANLDVLMGVVPKYNLYHLLNKEKTIWEIMCKGQNGLMFIPGGSGFNELLKLTEEQLDYFVEQVNELNGSVDFILFDTGAGLSQETLKFVVSADETIIVTTPEPTSITDAYAIIKMIDAMEYDVKMHMVINRVTDQKEGRRTAENIQIVARRFLHKEIATLGFVADDVHVSRAVKQQVPFSIAFPHSNASVDVREVAHNFISGHREGGRTSKGIRGFLNQMVKMLK